MTAPTGRPRPVARGGSASALADSRVITWRNLKRIPRIPELAIFAIFQSIMFVLLFAFVFGGAILLPGYTDPNAYREYLMPGIFAQTIVVRRRDDGDRHVRRHQQGDHRPLPLAADGALGGPLGPDRGRRHLQRRDPDRADAVGPRSSAGRSTTASRRSSPASGCCSCSPSRCRGSASGSGCRCRPSRSRSRCRSSSSSR